MLVLLLKVGTYLSIYPSILIKSGMKKMCTFGMIIYTPSYTFFWNRFLWVLFRIATGQWRLTTTWGSHWQRSVHQMLAHTDVMPFWRRILNLPTSMFMSVSNKAAFPGILIQFVGMLAYKITGSSWNMCWFAGYLVPGVV